MKYYLIFGIPAWIMLGFATLVFDSFVSEKKTGLLGRAAMFFFWPMMVIPMAIWYTASWVSEFAENIADKLRK